MALETTVYNALNTVILSRVPSTVTRVLDVGCAIGRLGENIKRYTKARVTGITISQQEANLARCVLDEVLVCDLNSLQEQSLGTYDCIICSHVLEHLYHPEEVLRRLASRLDSNGYLLVALPNILHWRQRLRFLSGNFRYTESGLLDHGHYRFFDWETARALVAEAGYQILSAEAEGTFPLSRYLWFVGKLLDRASVKIFPGLFGVQFIIKARR